MPPRCSSPRASTATTTGPTLPEEELQAEEDAQIEAATRDTAGSGSDAFAAEKQLLDEMTEIAEAARGLPDARVRYLVDWIRQTMCPDLPPLGIMNSHGSPGPVERHPDHHLHRVRRHQALPAPAALGRHRRDRPGRRADRHLSRPHAAGRAGGHQAGLQHRPEEASGPHPDRHRRRPRGAEPANPLLEPVPLRRAVEPQPPGAAQRPHRPQAPAQPEVYCHYFVYTDREEDRILKVLVRKTETIKKELGSLSQVLEGRLARTLRHGIRHRDIAALAREIEGTDPGRR